MSTKKMASDTNISNRVGAARTMSGISQPKAAENLGISTVTLSRYENGKRDVPLAVAISMARLYSVRESWLLTGEGPMLEGEQPSTPPEPPNVGPASPDRIQPKMVPLISWVQAGDWREVDDPYPPGYAEQWVQTFETDHPNAFALTVVGDSMQPEFTKGDIIIVDPGLEPASGDYVIAKNGEDATFKQLIRDGASVLLKPANDRYPIKDVTGQPVKIVGVVVGKQKQYR